MLVLCACKIEFLYVNAEKFFVTDLASEVSSDRPGITTTTAETTEIYSNYTPISSDTGNTNNIAVFHQSDFSSFQEAVLISIVWT